MEFDRDANEALAMILDAHGVAAVFEEGWFIAETGAPPISAAIVGETEHGENRIVQLDVRLALPDGRVLIESFAGWGPNSRRAVGSAFGNFVRNSWHVLLGAFFGRADDQVTLEEWERDDGKWRASIGPFGMQSGAGSPVPVPQNLFETFEQSVRRQRLDLSVHWFRIYYCNLGNGSVVCEALCDNEPWSAAAKAVEALSWQPSESYYSVRGFLVLQRIS